MTANRFHVVFSLNKLKKKTAQLVTNQDKHERYAFQLIELNSTGLCHIRAYLSVLLNIAFF